MSDKQNFAKQLIDNWQEGLQGLVKDEKFANVLAANYDKINQMFNDFAASAASNVSTNDADRDSQFNELKKRVNGYESRIAKLEKQLSRAGKSRK